MVRRGSAEVANHDSTEAGGATVEQQRGRDGRSQRGLFGAGCLFAQGGPILDRVVIAS